MKAHTTDGQLAWLEVLVAQLKYSTHCVVEAYEIPMLLSIAESVKAAKDHDLNCPKPGLATAEARLAWLVKRLEEYSDTVDGPDGQPRPNLAMQIASDYDNFLRGWIK